MGNGKHGRHCWACDWTCCRPCAGHTRQFLDRRDATRKWNEIPWLGEAKAVTKAQRRAKKRLGGKGKALVGKRKAAKARAAAAALQAAIDRGGEVDVDELIFGDEEGAEADTEPEPLGDQWYWADPDGFFGERFRQGPFTPKIMAAWEQQHLFHAASVTVALIDCLRPAPQASGTL